MAVKHETIGSLIAKLTELREKHGGETVVARRSGVRAQVLEVEERRIAADGTKFVSRQGRPCIAIS